MSRFICVVACVGTSFLFEAESYSIVGIQHILLLRDKHLWWCLGASIFWLLWTVLLWTWMGRVIFCLCNFNQVRWAAEVGCWLRFPKHMKAWPEVYWFHYFGHGVTDPRNNPTQSWPVTVKGASGSSASSRPCLAPVFHDWAPRP